MSLSSGYIITILQSGQLDTNTDYIIDFDHEFLEAEKFDAKRTHQHLLEPSA